MDIDRAVELLKQGEIIGFPTETVYGLGANAFDEKAVRKIYAAKGRPGDNPCIVHIATREMLNDVVKTVSPEAEALMDKFWPGPLTIIFEKRGEIPDNVTGGLTTVAVRMPSHPVALELIKKTGVPIAAPSANLSGTPSPTKASHVKEDFPDLFVIDGGDTTHGLESTVVSLHGNPQVLRLGSITLEQLQEVIPTITIKEGSRASPGTRYKHYTPRQPLIVCTTIAALKKELTPESVVLCKEEHAKEFSNNDVISLGTTNEEVAHNLYGALRTKKGEKLLVLALEKEGIGRTIMDRLERAASKVV